jgi:hypothetical protein
MDLQEIECEDLDVIHLVQGWGPAAGLMYTAMTSFSVKGGKFLKQLRIIFSRRILPHGVCSLAVLSHCTKC